MKKLTLLSFASLVSCALASSAFADTPSGTYQQSCQNTGWDGANLTTQCKVFGGNWFHGPVYVPTAIKNSNFNALNNNVANITGNLIANGVTPGGSWFNACTGSVYDVVTHTLAAVCDTNGNYNTSAIDSAPTPLVQVFNTNGNLTSPGVTPGGSWTDTCSFSVYQVPTHSLQAYCHNAMGVTGGGGNTQILGVPALDSVFNTNGNLTAPGVTPGGSWYNTCTASNYNFPTQTLTATCEDSRGGLHISSIQAAPTDSVFNNNGQLVK